MTTSVLHEFSRRGTKVHQIALIDGPNMSNLGHRSKKADGPNQVAVNPFGRLVDELKDGTFVVETNVSTSTPRLLPRERTYSCRASIVGLEQRGRPVRLTPEPRRQRPRRRRAASGEVTQRYNHQYESIADTIV